MQGAGVAASLNVSGEQWDAPNAWAPLQSIVVDALAAHGGVRGCLAMYCIAYTIHWTRRCRGSFRA